MENRLIGLIQSFELTTGDQPYQLFAHVNGSWSGLNIYIGGGTDPHIGAVAISTPRPSLSGSNQMSCTTSIYNCIGHKEDDIAKLVSETICLKYRCVVVVTCGVHIDKITPDGISRFKDLTQELLSRILIQLDFQYEI